MRYGKPTPQTLPIIAAALHLSILMYVFVVFILARQSEGWVMTWKIREENMMLLYALTFVSFSLIPIVLILPRLLGFQEQTSEKTLLGSFMEQSHQKDSVLDVKQMNLKIVQMAMAESIALFGFVLAILNQSFMGIIPYAILSLLLQFYVGPLREKLFPHPNL